MTHYKIFTISFLYLERGVVNPRGALTFDMPSKLEELSVMIGSTRSGVFRLEREISNANSNLTNIGNWTR